MADARPPGGEDHEPEDPGTGAPLEEIVNADLAGPAPAGFLERIRARIHRRSVAGHVVEFAGRGVSHVLMQWLLFFLDLFSPTKTDNKGES